MSSKNPKEIQTMRKGGAILAKVMEKTLALVKPGLTTEELNLKAEKEIRALGAVPSFLGYQGFPKSICTSINEEIVHGIPSRERFLQEGDILSIDMGVYYEGYHTDAALTVPVGRISEEDKKLIRVAKESLVKGLSEVRGGASLGSVGHVIQEIAENNGFSVVRDLTGHAVGRELHEDPSIPNFGDPNTGNTIKEGETLAIEPMLSIGDFHTETKEDGWTVVTQDRLKSAHFEVTAVVTSRGYENLTPILE